MYSSKQYMTLSAAYKRLHPFRQFYVYKEQVRPLLQFREFCAGLDVFPDTYRPDLSCEDAFFRHQSFTGSFPSRISGDIYLGGISDVNNGDALDELGIRSIVSVGMIVLVFSCLSRGSSFRR